MNHTLRSLTHLLLSGLMAIGAMPAWIHHADCQGHGACGTGPWCLDRTEDIHQRNSDRQDAESRNRPACSHGCAHHESDAALGATRPIPSHAVALEKEHHPGDPLHDHDSDSCSLCQNLLAPGGAIGFDDAIAFGWITSEAAFAIDQVDEASEHLCLTLSRGPPAV